MDKSGEVGIGKRYKLNKEDYVKQRIEAVRASYESFKDSNPEVVGLTLFGSTVRGEVKLASDLDAYVFIDAQRVASNLGVDESSILHTNELSFSVGDVSFDEELEYKYYKGFTDRVMASTGLEITKVKDIRIRPISNDIIDAEVDRLCTWSGESYASSNLQAMFYLQIGTDLDRYRKHVLERLEGKGELGEKVWEAVVRDLEYWEQDGKQGVGKYPKKLSEAKFMYAHVDSGQSI